MSKKPNIIVYLSDQQRHDSVGCYGQELPTSPVLDQLAKEGVLYENCYSCQPVCGPARASIQTGKYPTVLDAYINGYGLRLDEPTMAKAVAEVGYETAYVGKWHLSSDFQNGLNMVRKPVPVERMGGYTDYLMVSESLEMTSHGYDGYVFDKKGNRVDFIGYRTDCITDYAIHYLQNRTSDKPFLLFISHIEPHQQNDHNRYEGPDGSKDRFKDYKVPEDLLNGKYEGDWKENYADYLGQCRALDDNLGKLVNTLKDYGLYDNTVIIYSSDHGCHFRTQDGEYKRNSFDSSLHIPLVISGGPFKGGIRCNSMVSNIQIAATVLQLAGAKLSDEQYMVKESYLDALKDDYPRKEVFFQVSETECSRGIRTHKWKYSVWAPHVQPTLEMSTNFKQAEYRAMLAMSKADSDSYIEQYLFDLEKDPYEKNNLVADPAYANIRVELKERLVRNMAAAGEAIPEIYPAGTELPKQY